MLRPSLFLVFALALVALPSNVSAQKGKGPPGGMSGGGQQCQKGMQKSYPPTSQRGYPVVPASYSPAMPYSAPAQSASTTPTQAMQQTLAMLKSLVNQLKSLKVDSDATQALAADLKSVQQLSQSFALTPAQKEAQILQLMEQVRADLQALANENSLPTGQQSALASVVSRFAQLNLAAQQSSQLSLRAR